MRSIMSRDHLRDEYHGENIDITLLILFIFSPFLFSLWFSPSLFPLLLFCPSILFVLFFSLPILRFPLFSKPLFSCRLVCWEPSIPCFSGRIEFFSLYSTCMALVILQKWYLHWVMKSEKSTVRSYFDVILHNGKFHVSDLVYFFFISRKKYVLTYLRIQFFELFQTQVQLYLLKYVLCNASFMKSCKRLIPIN